MPTQHTSANTGATPDPRDVAYDHAFLMCGDTLPSRSDLAAALMEISGLGMLSVAETAQTTAAALVATLGLPGGRPGIAAVLCRRIVRYTEFVNEPTRTAEQRAGDEQVILVQKAALALLLDVTPFDIQP